MTAVAVNTDFTVGKSPSFVHVTQDGVVDLQLKTNGVYSTYRRFENTGTYLIHPTDVTQTFKFISDEVTTLYVDDAS